MPFRCGGGNGGSCWNKPSKGSVMAEQLHSAVAPFRPQAIGSVGDEDVDVEVNPQHGQDTLRAPALPDCDQT